ncbi:hypothetical protein GGF37_005212 [Kickxella alabastrina]|nr:hypothetical protein GGF37_005212 [Kickxella alabastrina]
MTAAASSFKPEATNSLVILFDHFTDSACDSAREALQAHGPLWHFAKLKSFERCLAVFTHTVDAQSAMRSLNLTTLLPDNNTIRLYYSMHTSLSQTQGHFLDVPAQERLWLISPPGSPSINWRQTREDPPNSVHLDSRIHAALRELSMGQFILNPADIPDYDSAEESDDLEHASATSAPFSLGAPALSDSTTWRSGFGASGIDSDSNSNTRDNDDDNNDDANAGGNTQNIGSENPDSNMGSLTPTILIQNYDYVDNTPRSHSLKATTAATAKMHPSIAQRPPTPGDMPRLYSPTARPPL